MAVVDGRDGIVNAEQEERRLRLAIDPAVARPDARARGIGDLLISAGSSTQMGRAFAGLVVVGAGAMAMDELFSLLEKPLTGRAHPGSQGHRDHGPHANEYGPPRSSARR